MVASQALNLKVTMFQRSYAKHGVRAEMSKQLMVEIVGFKQLTVLNWLKISGFLACECASVQKVFLCLSSWTSWICFGCHSAEEVPLAL